MSKKDIELIFISGNEAVCRDQLDQLVSSDPRTFVLGGPTGFLVLLRGAPDKKELQEGVRWEGDLPSTTVAQPADIVRCAEKGRWKQRAGGKSEKFFRTFPPPLFCTQYLTQMRGEYGARVYRGIARVPRIDDDGKVNFISGYDAQTGLFHDRPITFDLPKSPTRDDAREAVKKLLYPYSQYQFTNQIAGEATLLSAIFTAVERPFVPLAPMYIVRSPMAGVGKGKIARGLILLGFGTNPTFINWGQSAEEAEKRLIGILLQSPASLVIDNANDQQIKGELLCTLLAEGAADLRPLGTSNMVRQTAAHSSS